MRLFLLLSITALALLYGSIQAQAESTVTLTWHCSQTSSGNLAEENHLIEDGTPIEVRLDQFFEDMKKVARTQAKTTEEVIVSNTQIDPYDCLNETWNDSINFNLIITKCKEIGEECAFFDKDDKPNEKGRMIRKFQKEAETFALSLSAKATSPSFFAMEPTRANEIKKATNEGGSHFSLYEARSDCKQLDAYDSENRTLVTADFIANRLPEILDKNPSCKEEFAKAYRKAILNLPLNEVCFQIDKVSPDIKYNCERAKKSLLRLAQTLDKWLPEVTQKMNLPLSDSQCKDCSEKKETDLTPVAKVLNLDFELIRSQLCSENQDNKDAACSPLTVGESRLVNKTPVSCKYSSINGTLEKRSLETKKPDVEKSPYFMRRTSEKEFTAEVNLSFVRMPDKRTYIDDYGYEQHVQGCLDSVSPFMKSPDGSTLRIKISHDSRLPNRRIQLDTSDSPQRENSHQLYDSTTCSTLIHEVMHHLNLVDEYAEKKLGWTRDSSGKIKHFNDITIQPKTTSEELHLDYNCRSIGAAESLMAYPTSILAKIFSNVPSQGHYLEMNVCEAVNTSTLIQEQKKQTINVMNNGTCPFGSTQVKRLVPVALVAQISETNRTESIEKRIAQFNLKPAALRSTYNKERSEKDKLTEANDGDWVVKSGLPEKAISFNFSSAILVSLPGAKPLPSLLLPAHWNMITAPDCIDKNFKYYRCAEGAYRTDTGSGCPKKPDYCSKPELWLK